MNAKTKNTKATSAKVSKKAGTSPKATSAKTKKAVAKAVKEAIATAPKNKALDRALANTSADGRLRASTVDNPCWLVWDLAEKMTAKGSKRKDVIAECQKRGVAFYTARTQYQHWLSAKNAK